MVTAIGVKRMRLIDADGLDAEMYHKSFEVDDGRNVWNSGLWIRYKIFEEAIRDAPTIDAVPVVRCKDCKWYYRGGATCMYGDGADSMRGDDFCSRAERKQEKEE